MKLTEERRAVIEHALADAGVSLGVRHRFSSFGGEPAVVAELCRLVASGRKTATSSLEAVYAHYGVEYPRVGDVEILCDFEGALVAVVEITVLDTIPFEEVDDEHADLEGEGDRSLDHWMDVHRAFFERECTAMGSYFSDRTAVLCQRFRVTYLPR